MSDIMSKSIRPLTSALLCLGFGLSLQTTAMSAETEKGYLTTTAEEVVKDTSGECWKTSDGVPPPVEACGDAIVVVEEVDPCSLDTDGDGVNDCIDECAATIVGGKVDAVGCLIIEDLVLNATADEFEFDSAELKPEMKALLDDVAAQIEASPGHESIQVIGYTDSIGTEEYNLGLSERRAKAAADYLIQQGVAADTVSTLGMGESDPVADNSTREGRAQNRRVEIKSK